MIRIIKLFIVATTAMIATVVSYALIVLGEPHITSQGFYFGRPVTACFFLITLILAKLRL